jgi:hypothetical protein
MFSREGEPDAEGGRCNSDWPESRIPKSGWGGFGDGGVAGADVVAVVVNKVRVHLREQEGVYQHRDKNHQDEEVVARSRLIARVHK